MPTTAELERLEALVERLGNLGRKQRGSLIEAEDWNSLVASLVEVSRAVLADERAEQIPDHEHADQVSVGWLDARLSELVLGGPLADPAAKSQLGKLERQLAGFAKQLDDLDEVVAKLRARIGDVATRDLAREADLTRFGRRVEGMGDAREDVAALRGTLRSLEVDVRRAVDVSRQLEVDGAVVDIAGLVERVGAVEALRTSLTTPQGELFDAARFERRLNELRTSLVTEDELDEALSTVRTGGIDIDDLRSSLGESTRAVARETAADSVETFGSELRLEISNRFTTLDTSIETRFADATGDLEQSVLAAARDDIQAAVRAGDDALRADLQDVISSRLDDATSGISTRVDELAAGIDGRVGNALNQRLSGILQGIGERINANEVELAAAVERAQAAETLARTTATRVETIRRSGEEARSRLQSEINQRIEALDAANLARLDERVVTMREALRTDLRGDLEGTRRELERTLTAAARTAAQAEVRVASSQLRGEMREVVDEELSATRDELGSAIDERIAASDRRVAGIVADEVRRATSGLQQLVRSEVDAFRPELNRMIDQRIAAGGRVTPGPVVSQPPVITQPTGPGRPTVGNRPTDRRG